MKIVKPYAKMLPPDLMFHDDVHIYNSPDIFTEADGICFLRKIEYAARISHRSEDKMTYTSYDRFLRSVVLEHGDWSVTEHATVSVEFLVDRGITHEIVRHRLFSYTQESTRFVNYQKNGKEAEYICPYGDSESLAACTWRVSIENIDRDYRLLLNEGNAPQIARSVLPNALASKIIMTGNLRSWRHFFIMRTTKEAHPQMKEVTIPLLKEFQEKIPILYEDIVPETKQSLNLRLPK